MFSHNTIHLFMGQRHCKKKFGQFSFLLLIPQHAVGRSVPELRPHYPSEPWRPILDNQYVMHPTTDVAVTYLAARCFNGKHSEEILMSEFNILLRNFTLFYKQPPAGIVLYTLLAPCIKCVQAICKTFEAVTTIIPTCVVCSTGETLGVKVPSTSSLSVYTKVLAHNLNDIRNWASLIGLLLRICWCLLSVFLIYCSDEWKKLVNLIYCFQVLFRMNFKIMYFLMKILGNTPSADSAASRDSLSSQNAT